MNRNTTPPQAIFFLPYWDNENPTTDDQNGFMLSEMVAEDECLELGGEVYSNSDYRMMPKEFIKDVIVKERPKWVVGVENTATLLLSFHRQRKILVNPTVTLNDLNWVTADTIDNTYAFFSADFEKDYEVYSKVYRNVAFYPLQKTLHIGDISALIKEIISK